MDLKLTVPNTAEAERVLKDLPGIDDDDLAAIRALPTVEELGKAPRPGETMKQSSSRNLEGLGRALMYLYVLGGATAGWAALAWGMWGAS